MLKVILFLLFISQFSLGSEICQSNLDSFPVLTQGRVKPYMVAAVETIKHLTGKTKVDSMPASEVFCKLSLSYLINSQIKLFAKVDHQDLRKLLKVENEHEIEYSKIPEFTTLLRAEYSAQKLNNSYKKSINTLMIQMQYYDALTQGSLWTIPVNTGAQIAWHGLKDIITQDNLSQMGERLEKGKEDFIKAESDDYLIEVTYTKLNIFSLALLLAIFSIIATVLSRNIKVAYLFTAIVLITEIIGMTFRVMISGRAPITNMYETVMFSGFGALLIAVLITIWKKDKIFIIAGLGYNTLCLFMMRFSGGMLEPSISPLVPVLRDNFWLSTHVTTIILSYAALALSWMLANITLFKERFTKITTQDRNYYSNLIYTSIKVGIVLLATGIILGGVWADYSWGRFWGWDPKETWSLIVLLFYVAVVHAKSTNWVNHKKFINLASIGFLTVMMAWFGVNYILASGLHSYGFSEGGAIFLGVFFLIQIVYVAICNAKFGTENAETN